MGLRRASGQTRSSAKRSAPASRRQSVWAIVLLAAALGSTVACAPADSASEPARLTAGWQYQLGDDPGWSRTGFDDSSWTPVDFPVGWDPPIGTSDFVWFRTRYRLPPAASESPAVPFGISLGPINSAYELFVNGELIGKVGIIAADPGHSLPDYDRHGLFALSPALVRPGGELEIALRVWRDPQTRTTTGGPFEGVPRVGQYDLLASREISYRVVGLALTLFFSAIGLFHLELFRRSRRDTMFLWLGGLGLGTGAYTLLRTPWKDALGLDFVGAKDLEHVIAFLLIPTFVQFLWKVLYQQISPGVRVYQWANVVAAVAVASPGLSLNFLILPYWQAAMVVALLAGTALAGRRAWRRAPEALIILPGYLAVAATIVNDVLIDRGWHDGPRLTSVGFAILLASFATSVADRVLRSGRELRELRLELETRVATRTAELVEANEAKSRFLATMSHEIRTPLNAVLGTNRILLERSLGSEERELVEGAQRSGQILLSLIEDVLDFSRIESGHVELVSEPFDLEAACEEAFEISAARASEKRIDFALVLDRDLPVSVVGDALRLRQVLVNLIGNAVKFTERGWVLVEVHPESAPGSSSVRFRVSDTGPGIAADQIELVFERFRQVDSSFSRRFPGAGLGLAICKALVHHMGGSLSAESRLGVGSKFEVTLPLPASAGDRPVPRPWALGRKVRLRCLPEATLRSVTQLLEGAGAAVVEGAGPGAAMTGRVDLEIAGPADPSAGAETGDIGPATGTACARRLELVHSLKAEDDPAGSAEAVDRLALPLRPSVLRQYLCELWQVPDRNRGRIRTHDSRAHDMGRLPLRVLVADDDEMGRKITCAMLANMSVRPIAVGDGAEALRAIETSSFDLVFLDLQMPLLDGVEVARRARQLLGEACPRLVALSANVTKADRERCAHVGIRRFVAKPVRPEALLEVLRALELERRGDTAPAPHAVPSGEARS